MRWLGQSGSLSTLDRPYFVGLGGRFSARASVISIVQATGPRPRAPIPSCQHGASPRPVLALEFWGASRIHRAGFRPFSGSLDRLASANHFPLQRALEPRPAVASELGPGPTLTAFAIVSLSFVPMRQPRANQPDGYVLGSYRIATAPEPKSRRLRVPIDPVQGARHNVLLCRVDRPGERFHPIRPRSRPRWRPERCLHHFVSHPPEEEGIGLVEVLDRVTMQLFVCGNRTMIAAPVQSDVNGISKRSHHVSLPRSELDWKF